MSTIVNPITSLNDLKISPKIKNFIHECIENNIPIEQIGNEFEKTKLSDEERKKKHGQFYTPDHIVRYMLKYLSIDHTMNIVDPACGTGTFLLPILKKFYQGKAIETVYGIDIDAEALDVLKALLFLHKLKINDRHLIHGNTVVSNPEISNQALDVKTIAPEKGFDVVIGNPPYVTLKKDTDYDSHDEDFSQIINGQVNAATLMIARGMRMLKPNGILAFVLPKNILHVGSYSKLRDYLLTKTTILHIVDLRSSFKDVRGEQIILFVQKKKPEPTHKIEFKVIHNENVKSTSIFIPQQFFVEQNKIYVFARATDYQLIKKLSVLGSPLKDLVDDEIFRGLSIPSKLQSQSNSEFASDCVPYVRGKNIQKFSIEPKACVDKKTNTALANPKIDRILNKKIVVQNIFSSESGLICAYDNKGILTNETVTNILIDDETIGMYLLGLLNSKLANYFLIFGCYNCSKMTMHTDKEYIGSIPVVVCEEQATVARIESIVKVLSNQAITNEIMNELKRELDQCFYNIYQLQQEEIAIIESGLDLFLSKKSRW